MSIKSAAKEIRPMGLRESLKELFEMHNTGVLKSGDTLLEEAARRYLEGID
jgi:hypothetical protein